MRFAYFRDPLFLACFFAYCAHTFAKKCGVDVPLLRAYLNDLICIPFWIPIMLWSLRKLGLRPHDRLPQAYEVVIPLVIWAVVFEVVLPSTRTWAGLVTPDPNDVLCYALGGLIAMRFWGWRYGQLTAPES